MILRRLASRGMPLPAGILIIILLMVMPIPAFLLDIFFVINIALSIAVLMAAMNAKKPLDFSSFPSVLLFATLLRLALNVASTRVVLLYGHENEAAAGHVIEAFGAFLIGGNFAVGIFVFLILMVINLMVVTKGAGRVSEVTARFTLDALPGKQMAIDADLAAGLLTADEAKARRREVATEADFYGSMDGASKFVKGDAVAALLILAINVIAGLVLGTVSHGMSVGDAGARYVTLAIGDALVASVPALLLSIAAAVIVTRVSDNRDLTGQIGGQLGQSGTWLPVGGILGILGAIPAMPQMIFLPLAAGALLLWYKLRQREERLSAPPAEAAPPVDLSRVRIEEVTDQTLVTLQLGFGLIHLTEERAGAPLVQRLTGLRRQMCQAFGFVIPQFRIEDSFELEPDQYRLMLGGVPLGSGSIRAGRYLAVDTGDVMGTTTVPGEPTVEPSFGCLALWVEAAVRDTAIAEGYMVVDAESVIATHINQLLARQAHALLGPDQVRDLLDYLRGQHAQLVDTVTPNPLPLAAVTRLFKSLLSDGISLRHSLRILASLSQACQQTNDHDHMIDMIRVDLGGMLVGDVCGPNERLPVLTLAARLEEMVVNGLQDPATGTIVIDPDLARSIGEHVGAILASLGSSRGRAALIVQPRARRALAALLASRAPGCTVLSINELPSAQPIEVVAVIGEDEAAPALAAPDKERLAA